jgi:protocatechuate 3,4-dioxygenase beta subunit
MIDPDNAAYVRLVHDKGLRFDRRRLLTLLGSAAVLSACTDSATPAPSASSSSALAEVASETAGPYPADGSNGPDVRTIDGIVRKDIRSSFGTATGKADGVPLEFALVVLDRAGKPVSGAAVYAWHCDKAGNYSMYSTAVASENYLRGIQVTDATGTVAFTSIYPACYTGRWPHIHFEVYGSADNATSGNGPIVKTSQIALPEDISHLVYATDGYSASVTNMKAVSLATDNVFGDDKAVTELATVTGSVSEGYRATLTISIDPSDKEQAGGMAPPGGGTPPSGMPGGPGGPGGAPPSAPAA